MNKNNSIDAWRAIEKEVFIIAEIGKNFIQTEKEQTQKKYIQNAKKLISLAKDSGADAVKFQTHNLEDEQMDVKVVAPHFSGADRYAWVKRNESVTPASFWEELKDHCEKEKITFFSTPMSRGAAMKLEKVGVTIWKIGSGDILDFVMLDYIAKTEKPIIISSGMSTLKEVDKAIAFLAKRNCKVALLHCVSKYPCPSAELNLNTIKFYKKRYNIPIGFSDHSMDSKSCLAAVELGATIIEKHFSLNRSLWGSDHKVSLNPGEFKNMVVKIRKKESVDVNNYGLDRKILNDGESIFRPIFRKSLVASRDIKKGEKIKEDMLYAMRPQAYIEGLPSEEYENVLGKLVNKDVKKYHPIKDKLLS